MADGDRMTWGRPGEFTRAPLPPFPGFRAAWGPGVIWMALAQGSGELIWWPYLVAKYGLSFLFLLIPACLLQYAVTYEIGRYTLLTGESIMQGFIRLNRVFALLLWVMMVVSFLWFGAFASAGGTALAAMTNFPTGWTERGQTLFWAYASIALFSLAILGSRIIYRLIERFMTGVAVLTGVGLMWACAHPRVLGHFPAFLRGLIVPERPLPRPWETGDTTKLLTAIAFAGLGGFWTLFYSYWLREKGVGMAAYMGKVTGPITGKPEVIPEAGFVADDTSASSPDAHRWGRYLIIDSGIGIFGNIGTTLMTCLLAYALLYPEGILPEHYQIAVVQSRFFEVSWGPIGRLLFLLVSAAFLSDTWLATVDAVSRVYTDFVQSFFPASRRLSYRSWYYLFLLALTVVTSLTILIDEPGPLIILSAIIGFIGTVIYSVALLLLNHVYLPRFLPPAQRPGRGSLIAIGISCLAYAGLVVVFLYIRFWAG